MPGVVVSASVGYTCRGFVGVPGNDGFELLILASKLRGILCGVLLYP